LALVSPSPSGLRLSVRLMNNNSFWSWRFLYIMKCMFYERVGLDGGFKVKVISSSLYNEAPISLPLN